MDVIQFRREDGGDAALWKAYFRRKTAKNRNRLVEYHLPMARHMANHFQRKRHISSWVFNFDDLFSEATIALCRAVEFFDPGRGVKFSTYACRGMYQQMTKFACEARNGIRGVQYPREDYPKIERLAVETDTRPAYDPPDNRLRPEISEDAQGVAEALKFLDKRDQRAIRMRHWDGMGLEEIGDQLGVSKERARQILLRAHAKLRRLGKLHT